MKFGVCKDIKELAKFDSSVVDYCEMSLSNIFKMTDEELEERIAISKATNIPMLAANGFFPKEVPLCGPDYDGEKVKAYTETALMKANKLGIKTLVLGSGKARYIEDGWDKESCIAQFTEAAGIAGDVAAKYDMMIVIEPLQKGETNSINTVAEGAEVVRNLKHPNVMLLCDVFHFALENEPLSNITDNGDILRHFHIANPDGRLYPKASDEYDYKKIVDSMKEIGYDALLSIEGKAIDLDVDLVEGIKFLKEIFN